MVDPFSDVIYPWQETLFDGYPGTANVKRKLNRLLGVTECDDSIMVNDRPRNPAWVSVCIKSYYVSKSDVWGSRNFRIFDTKIVDGPWYGDVENLFFVCQSPPFGRHNLLGWTLCSKIRSDASMSWRDRICI